MFHQISDISTHYSCQCLLIENKFCSDEFKSSQLSNLQIQLRSTQISSAISHQIPTMDFQAMHCNAATFFKNILKC